MGRMEGWLLRAGDQASSRERNYCVGALFLHLHKRFIFCDLNCVCACAHTRECRCPQRAEEATDPLEL